MAPAKPARADPIPDLASVLVSDQPRTLSACGLTQIFYLQEQTARRTAPTVSLGHELKVSFCCTCVAGTINLAR